jgi:CheY-like chemotaxis protein
MNKASSHVLVIEDEAAVAEEFTDTLRSAGLRITVANDGFTALRAQDLDPADCVLLDLRLPDMRGGDVALDLRSRRPDLPIVVVTGYPVEAAALPITADEILYKPIRPADLARLVCRFCANAASGGGAPGPSA